MIITTSLALALAAASAQAQEVEVEVIKAEHGPHQVRVVQLAGTREETAAMAAERFERRDRDGNGVLEGAEMRAMGIALPHPPIPPMPPMPPMDMGKMFEKIDSDGDGMISREEFDAHHKHHAMPGKRPVVLHRLHREGDVKVDVEQDGDHRVIVKKRVIDGGEEVDVTVHAMDEDAAEGAWTTDEGRTMMIERIERIAGGADEDADGDGRITREEAIDSALARFDALDTDGDGTLGKGERAVLMGHGED